MALPLADLEDRYLASLNAPGENFIGGTSEQNVLALANGFWQARAKGAFVGYRIDPDTMEVVAVDGGDDLAEHLHQLIVMSAVVLTIEAKLLALPTGKRAKAGPVETETQRSANLLIELLKGKRAELDEVKDDVAGTNGVTTVAVIDSFMARTWAIADQYASWVA